MNIQVQVCGLVIMLLLYFFYRSSNTLKLYTEKIFHQSMCVSIVCLCLDILSIVVIHNKDILPLLLVESVCKIYIITLIWVAMFAFVYVLTDLFNEERHSRWTRIIRGIILVESIIVYLLPISIYKEGTIVYSYGPAVLSVYAFVTIYILATLSILFIRFKELNKRRVFSVGLWMFVYISAALIQFFYSQLLLVGFASAIGVLILFVFMENPEANLDRRFGCFNSYALTEYIHKQFERKTVFGVMEISLKDVEYLEEHGVHIEQVLRSIVDVIGPYAKLKVFKNINSNIMIVSKDIAALQMVGENILNNIATDTLLRKNIRIILLADSSVLGSVNEVMHFFTFLRHTYASDVEGILSADEKMISRYMEKFLIEEKITQALQDDRVEVFLQPIYSNKEKCFTCAEALVRIREQDGSLLAPGAFIPIAEENGQIVELGERVFELVCKFIKEHDLQELRMQYIEINLSVIQCQMHNLSERLISIAQKYEIDPAKINLEITETGSISARNVLLKNMKALIEYGFTFSLDDFGKGESNLMYVVEMPVSIVKIDYDMSKAYFNTERAKHVLKAVVEMAHGMELKLVAEGIETADELHGMHKEGIDYIQGYYYSKPLPQKEFLAFVNAHNLG